MIGLLSPRHLEFRGGPRGPECTFEKPADCLRARGMIPLCPSIDRPHRARRKPNTDQWVCGRFRPAVLGLDWFGHDWSVLLGYIPATPIWHFVSQCTKLQRQMRFHDVGPARELFQQVKRESVGRPTESPALIQLRVRSNSLSSTGSCVIFIMGGECHRSALRKYSQ
jgi:hypothetical protein